MPKLTIEKLNEQLCDTCKRPHLSEHHYAPVDGSEYYVVFGKSDIVAIYPDFETAARTWDALTYEGFVVGGIQIRTYQNISMVRNGWLVKVSDDGSCYVNPNMKAE